MSKRSRFECSHPKQRRLVLGNVSYLDKERNIWVEKTKWRCQDCLYETLDIEHTQLAKENKTS